MNTKNEATMKEFEEKFLTDEFGKKMYEWNGSGLNHENVKEFIQQKLEAKDREIEEAVNDFWQYQSEWLSKNRPAWYHLDLQQQVKNSYFKEYEQR